MHLSDLLLQREKSTLRIPIVSRCFISPQQIKPTLILRWEKYSTPYLETEPQPRTAVGLDKNGKKLTIVIVDGRQPGYSQGATLLELAGILLEFNVHNGMNLDGGGSSTLVVMDSEGKSKVLNSPVDNHIPGRERAIGNHLGFFAKPKK